MTNRAIQLVLQYDGSEFAGWQRQPSQRTVQGALEEALVRLTGQPVPVLGAGRTDAGVHARGQAAGVVLAEKWTVSGIRRALNAILPGDVWVAAAHEMDPAFHARFSATARRYSYRVGTTEDVRSPFRRRWEHAAVYPLDRSALDAAAGMIIGEHCFLAFAVRGTAREGDTHCCRIEFAQWRNVEGGLVFDVGANRFLHHMVRFLVGTMLEIGGGRRPLDDMRQLLQADANDDVSPPAPAHALCLECVQYPDHLYRRAA